MTQQPRRDAYKVSEVASRMGMSDDSVRRLVASGELAGVRVGGLIMISAESYEALLARVRGSAVGPIVRMDAPGGPTMDGPTYRARRG